jgi:putative DNA primase/helicase
VNLVADYLPALCIPAEDPLTYFDNNPDLLPLKNGVWKFSESRLVPYEREHYFTHKIPINYNPDADTSLIRRAMNDWFKSDNETISYLQHIIGYCLTGYTTKQIFLVAWGSEAGNGKSLLWGEIIPSLLGQKYYARITSDAFADTANPNNDQLYYLNGKRYAFMSEPRKGAKAGAMDNELVKTVTGDKEMTAQAKYKGKLTYTLRAKILAACNDLPEFNCDDKGMMRRFVPFSQNVACLDESDYNAAPANLKADGSVIKKDDEFVKALLADTEGTLCWALAGANDYVANPRREPPDSMKETKTKARANIDTLTAWLSGNLEAGPKHLAFSTLKAEWRSKGLNFEQTKKGFAGRLANKIKMLGFTVDEGRAGKSEERVLNCALVPDKIDGLLED